MRVLSVNVGLPRDVVWRGKSTVNKAKAVGSWTGKKLRSVGSWIGSWF